jgi:hypothetical protein
MNVLGNEIQFGTVTEKQSADVADYFSSWSASHRVERFLRHRVNSRKTVYKSGETFVMKEFVTDTRFREYKVPETPDWKFHSVTRHVVVYTRGKLSVELVAETRPSVRTVSLYFSENPEAIQQVILGILNPLKLYSKLTGHESFLGRPRRVTRSVLDKKNYSVTGSHGDRRLFYIDVHGVLSFVTRDMEFVRIRNQKPRIDYTGTILDGEIQNGTFYARDVLFARGKDVRGKKLPERLELLFEILMGLRLDILRMNIVYIDKGSGIHEYPGNKRSQFQSIEEASRFIWETQHPKSLVYTSVDFGEPTFEWTDVSFPKEYRLKKSLETFFENRDKLEKLLLHVHKHDRFVGHTRVVTDPKLPFLGQPGVDFKKFTRVMDKWDFRLVSNTTQNAHVHFIFEKTK